MAARIFYCFWLILMV